MCVWVFVDSVCLGVCGMNEGGGDDVCHGDKWLEYKIKTIHHAHNARR